MTAPQTLTDLRAGRLAGATRLDLRHAGLAEIPPELYALADTLEWLDLSGNALHELPAGFARLHRLRTLFCSNNRFERLPAVLGRCASLGLLGFKANAIAEVPAAALPAGLRWLILTDNRVEALPAALGRCAQLQKLMLAGNRLAALPALDGCTSLELIRLAANRFATIAAALPDALLALPRLAWIAYAGNPFNEADEERVARAAPIPEVEWAGLEIGALIGEGASGHIHAAAWRPDGAAARAVAVKRFKGAMTSDGLPRSEMAACLAAGAHPSLVSTLGRVTGHPQHAQGLVMEPLPADMRVLADPPSLASCTRDVYADDRRFTAAEARAIAADASSALRHLHARGVLHGDFYAHNLHVDAAGRARLGDFGAASLLPQSDEPRAARLRALDERALGILLDELALRCEEPGAPAAIRTAAEDAAPARRR